MIWSLKTLRDVGTKSALTRLIHSSSILYAGPEKGCKKLKKKNECPPKKEKVEIDCSQFPKHKETKLSNEEIMNKDACFVCQNYCTLPVSIVQGQGVCVTDVCGKKYLDFIGGFSSVNQGHCHPKIYCQLLEQAKHLTICTRSLYSDVLVDYAEFMTQLFCYDKILPMNTGVEAAETAIKLARKWGYKVKKIKECHAKVIFPDDNYWGRTIAAISASTFPEVYTNYGPFVPGFETVPFNDMCALEEILCQQEVCAFMLEPIQGEAGIILPDDGYLKKVRELCTKNNVLLIADEIQTGLGRTGCLIACDYEEVKPDILVLGKSLGGGFIPVSAVLADDKIMCVMEKNTHASTYGGNPLACSVAKTAVKTIIDEKLSENAVEMGEMLREELKCLPKDVVCEVRGRGLFNALEISDDFDAWEICFELMKNGLLAKPTRDKVIRLIPPLVIDCKQTSEAIDIIQRSIEAIKCGGKK